MANLKVHGVSLSPFVRKVLFALAYKEQPYDQVNVFPGDTSDEFAAISPLNKIPVLEDDGFTIPDSSIILRYLEAKFPEKPLYPADPQQQARACWLEEYADTKLTECCAGLFRERFLARAFFKRDPDEALIQTILTETIPPVLDYLESVVQAEGFFLGDHLTVADLGITSAFCAASYADFQPDAKSHPKLAGYVARAMESPIVVARMAEEQKAAANLGVSSQ